MQPLDSNDPVSERRPAGSPSPLSFGAAMSAGGPHAPCAGASCQLRPFLSFDYEREALVRERRPAARAARSIL